MRVRPGGLVVCSVLLLAPSVHAGDISGTFVAESNPAVTLDLRESPPGTVTGSVLFPVGGITLRARRSGNELRGTMGGGDEQVAIRLLPDGDRLRLEPLEGPDRQSHVFQRARASAARNGVAAAGHPGGVTIISGPDGSMTVIEPGPSREPAVIVNGRRISPADVARLERTYGVQVRPADYWYDRVTGAWGLRGGPTRGFIHPGLELGGGTLAADASGGGGTGIFVNGRELHPDEVAGLRTCFQVQTGRWWVLANGLVGREGGPGLFNMSACARQGSGGGGGLGCEGASCGTWRTRTGVTGYTSEGGGQGAVHYNGQLLMTPN